MRQRAVVNGERVLEGSLDRYSAHAFSYTERGPERLVQLRKLLVDVILGATAAGKCTYA